MRRTVTAETHAPSGKVLFRLPTIGVSAAVDEAEAELVVAEVAEALEEARRRRAGPMTVEAVVGALLAGAGKPVVGGG